MGKVAVTFNFPGMNEALTWRIEQQSLATRRAQRLQECVLRATRTNLLRYALRERLQAARCHAEVRATRRTMPQFEVPNSRFCRTYRVSCSRTAMAASEIDCTVLLVDSNKSRSTVGQTPPSPERRKDSRFISTRLVRTSRRFGTYDTGGLWRPCDFGQRVCPHSVSFSS